MAGQRRSDQKAEAFSAPKSLLAAAGAEATRRRMTKSGFYRYCLAKELGYSEADAMELAEHRAVTNALENNASARDQSASPAPMSHAGRGIVSSKKVAALVAAGVDDDLKAAGLSQEQPPKREAGGPSARTSRPTHVAHEESK